MAPLDCRLCRQIGLFPIPYYSCFKFVATVVNNTKRSFISTNSRPLFIACPTLFICIHYFVTSIKFKVEFSLINFIIMKSSFYPVYRWYISYKGESWNFHIDYLNVNYINCVLQLFFANDSKYQPYRVKSIQIFPLCPNFSFQFLLLRETDLGEEKGREDYYYFHILFSQYIRENCKISRALLPSHT